MSKWNKKEKEQQGASELKRKLAAQMEDEKYGAALGTVASMIEKGVKDADAFYDTARLFYQIKKPAHGAAIGKKIVHDEDMFAGFQIFL